MVQSTIILNYAESIGYSLHLVPGIIVASADEIPSEICVIAIDGNHGLNREQTNHLIRTKIQLSRRRRKKGGLMTDGYFFFLNQRYQTHTYENWYIIYYIIVACIIVGIMLHYGYCLRNLTLKIPSKCRSGYRRTICTNKLCPF